MSRCEHTSKLTAHLLGDLPKSEADALAAHLTSCASCRAAADALSETLALLREAYPADAKGAPAPVLDAARREALLAVRPAAPADFRTNWFTRRHPRLAWAAALVTLAGGVIAVVSSVTSVKKEARLGLDLKDDRSWRERALTRQSDRFCYAGAHEGESAGQPVGGGGAGAAVAAAPAPAPVGLRAKELGRANALGDGLNAGGRFAGGRKAEASSGPAPREAAVSWLSSTTEQQKRSTRRERSKDVAQEVGLIAADKVATDAPRGAFRASLAEDAKKAGAAAPAQDAAARREGSASQAEAPAEPERRVRLNIEVPKPQFTGTPKDIRSPNLEAAGARDNGPFLGYAAGGTVSAKQESKPAATTALSLDTLRRDEWFSAEQAGKPVAMLEDVSETTVWDSDFAAAQTDAGAKAKRLTVASGRELKTETEPADLYAGVRVDALRKKAPALANPFVAAAAHPFSTFAIDVDTASYTLTRQALRAGALPEPERVRTEEIVNAFDYGDTAPERAVFRVYQDGAQAPFGAGLHLLRIGVKGKRLGREEQRPAVLTFVIDVSGSMSQPDRIGFARLALASLLEQMGPADRIQLIAYSDRARLALEPVAASEKARVLAAFDQLQCNGSTNLEEGMRLAYEQAVKSFVPGAENRVILLSDGVANLGADSAQEILAQVASSRKQGITCSVFGVGAGTYNDRLLEELANKGDGVYRFLDSEAAVKSAFVDDLAATLNTIAKDAKIQVEWNPKSVRRYRQLGYENRALTREQFRDDAVDAGEVGSGQSVTALYELELAPDLAPAATLGTVRVRYQRADTGKVEEIEAALGAATVLRPAHAATPHLRVAACAAEFAELLRGSPHASGGRFDAVADYLRPAALELSLDTRVSELLELVSAAAALKR